MNGFGQGLGVYPRRVLRVGSCGWQEERQAAKQICAETEKAAEEGTPSDTGKAGVHFGGS